MSKGGTPPIPSEVNTAINNAIAEDNSGNMAGAMDILHDAASGASNSDSSRLMLIRAKIYRRHGMTSAADAAEAKARSLDPTAE